MTPEVLRAVPVDASLPRVPRTRVTDGGGREHCSPLPGPDGTDECLRPCRPQQLDRTVVVESADLRRHERDVLPVLPEPACHQVRLPATAHLEQTDAVRRQVERGGAQDGADELEAIVPAIHGGRRVRVVLIEVRRPQVRGIGHHQRDLERHTRHRPAVDPVLDHPDAAGQTAQRALRRAW